MCTVLVSQRIAMVTRATAAAIIALCGVTTMFAAGGCGDDRDVADSARDASMANDSSDRLDSEATQPQAAMPDHDDDDAGLQEWVAAPRNEYAGRPLFDWVSDWIRWHLSQNDCSTSAYVDIDGSFCGTQQQADSPVFFLETSEYPTTRTQCTVPLGKALLVPLTYFVSDGRDERFHMLSPEELRVNAEKALLSMRDFKLELQGNEHGDFAQSSMVLSEASAEFPPAPNYYTCRNYPKMEGPRDHIYVAGIYVLLEPPAGAGEYSLLYGGTFSRKGLDVVTEVTTLLNYK